MDMNGRLCTMAMTLTGSFSQEITPPLNEDGTPYVGCWPYGTWTFTAARGTTDCTPQPTILPQYQFKVTQVTDPEGYLIPSYTYMTDPATRSRIKVSQGGDGLCEGEASLFSADGKEIWVLKPEMYADLSVRGDGEYSKYGSDQFYQDAP